MPVKLSLVFALGLLINIGGVEQSMAQQTGVALSDSQYDNSLPLEITSDRLDVAQAENTAEFFGNAKAVQGDIILTSDHILVLYNQEQSSIEQVVATGNVIFTNGIEVAEGNKGVYIPNKSEVVMTGNVLLLQGPNAISGDQLNMDLVTNQGTMQGNVKTIFVPKSDE